MSRTAFRGGWVVVLSSLLFVFPAGASALAKQRHDPRRVPTQPPRVVEIIDGTPRVTPSAHPAVSPPAGRWTPPAPGDRTGTSLQTINDQPGMASPLGGDDVLVASYPRAITTPPVWLQTTNDGRLFVAVISASSPDVMDVYRSVDGGDTWTLWSTFSAGFNAVIIDFMIAQGDVDRAFIAYSAFNGATIEVDVAHTDLNTETPVWTAVTAIEDPSFNTADASFDSDAWGFSDYYIYLVARANDGNGSDIWFARSFDLGGTFEPEVKIADVSDGSNGFNYAQVRTGYSGYVHVILTRVGTLDGGIYYRRAANFADDPWEPMVTIDAVDNGNYSQHRTLSPSHTTNNVLYSMISGVSYRCRYSTDGGATWPVSNNAPMPAAVQLGASMAQVGADLVTSGYSSGLGTHEYLLAKSTTGLPTGFAAPEELSISTAEPPGSQTAIIVNATRGNRIGVIWDTLDATTVYIRFDAEWRRDPGYPNTDIGFPVYIQGGGQTPPAVAEVDGDPEKEIVFGTVSGDIHVFNHDGTEVPGWPVNIGSMPYDAPVAVGDLVGNGIPTVVAGNAAGQVYAFDPSGNLLPGWPVDLGTGTGVFVSIGALGPPSTRYVVALSFKTVAILNHSGTNVAPAWTPAEIPFGTYSRPAAIGDIDNDGVPEIVSLAGPNVYYHHLNDPLFTGQQFAGETFSDAPTLADIDNDGIYEVAAPTASGKMYLFHKDGSSFSPSWPITVAPGVPLTSAAMGNIVGGFEVDMAFAEANGAVHLRWYDGSEQGSYPKASGSTALFMPPMLSNVNINGANINIGTTDGVNGTGQSWRNLGFVPDGWPRNFPGPVEETFAGGDIDNDGRNELVVLGVNFLSVYDVGQPPNTQARSSWEMYGHDAQRTGCLDCEEILSGVGDTPAVAYSTGIDVHPNPFNPTTTIEYEVARAGRVSLEVFDVSGHKVATLIDNEQRGAGRYSVSYSAAGSSGVYFARLRTAGGEVTRKMVVLK